MNDLEREELSVLARARSALAPSAEDERRILQATLERAAMLDAVGTSAAAGSAGSSSARAGLSAGSAARWLLALTLSVATGIYGYCAGFEAGKAAREQPVAAAAQRAVAAAPPAVREAPAVSAPARVEAAEAAADEVVGRRSAARKTSAGSAPAAPVQKLSLADELALLKRVERALREGEPGLALELLDGLELAEPAPALAEERLAATVMARCALGLGGRARLADDFARAHPDSVYRARVDRACSAP